MSQAPRKGSVGRVNGHRASATARASGAGGVIARPGPRLRGTSQREQDRLADAEAGDRHQQAVDTHAHPAGRRHAVLKRLQEVLVEPHRLVVAAAPTGACSTNRSRWMTGSTSSE